MSFWGSILNTVFPWRMLTPRVNYIGAHDMAGLLDPTQLSAAQMWRSQSQLRTVVDFRARNIAQIGLHVYQRMEDGGRERDHSSAMARALQQPDVMMDAHQLFYALSVDLDLHDKAYWLITVDEETGQPRLRRLPPAWVSVVWESPWEVKEYHVSVGDAVQKVAPENILAFPGYAPESVYGCSPALETLKESLREQTEARRSRMQMWKNKARLSGVLQRPLEAPSWSKEAKRKFLQDWKENFTGDGAQVGGTPLLPDGMKLEAPPRSDLDNAGYSDVVKLTRSEVASAFHVNPSMIGDNDGANYSNVREFRKMLYSDTLGPTLDRIENVLNTFLLPRLGMDRGESYVEFNVKEKLRGNFSDEARVLTTAVGAPYMTPNEARARQNMPAVDDGDELIRPLNVVSGGQASPSDSGSQNETTGENNDVEQRSARSAPAVKVKSASPDQFSERLENLFRSTFDRQRQAVKSRVGSGGMWWDEDRWDEELADDLSSESSTVVLEAATQVLAELGIAATAFNLAGVTNYLMQRSEGQAHDMNEATQAALRDRITGSDSDTAAIDEYFDGEANTRAISAGAATAAALAGFAAVEAGRSAGVGAQKRWVVTSSNPRNSHAAMNGETVGVDEVFSNGLRWPGGLGAGADESAGCMCELEIIPGN